MQNLMWVLVGIVGTISVLVLFGLIAQIIEECQLNKTLGVVDEYEEKLRVLSEEKEKSEEQFKAALEFERANSKEKIEAAREEGKSIALDWVKAQVDSGAFIINRDKFGK